MTGPNRESNDCEKTSVECLYQTLSRMTLKKLLSNDFTKIRKSNDCTKTRVE